MKNQLDAISSWFFIVYTLFFLLAAACCHIDSPVVFKFNLATAHFAEYASSDWVNLPQSVGRTVAKLNSGDEMKGAPQFATGASRFFHK